MRLWLRARRVRHLAATLVVIGVFQAFLDGRFLFVPLMVGTLGVSTWSMFLPVVLGVALADAMASKTQGVEQRVGGHVVILDVLLLILTAAAGAATLATLGGTHPHLAGTIGQVMIAVGASTVATLRWGVGPGILVPVAVAIACLGYGLDAPAGAFVRVMAPDSNPWWDLAIGSALLASAALVIATRQAQIHYKLADRLTD